MAITARFAADFSSFYSAVDKADAKLTDFTQGAGRVEKALNRMVDQFSGRRLIQEATLMEKAVAEIGGASKLTAGELERVSAKASDAVEKLRAMGADVPAGLQKLADASMKVAKGIEQTEQKTTIADKAFAGMATKITSVAAGMVSAEAAIGLAKAGFRTLTEFISGSVASFSSAEAASRKLEQSLRAQSTATPQLIARYGDLAAQFQKTSVFSDDLVTDMQSLLVQVGDIMPSQMEGALKASTDLAAGLGIDLQTATNLVAKAAAGHTETLGRYGITVSDAAVQTKGFDATLEAIESRFGGQASAQLDTYAGRVQALANAWDNVKEVVGGALVGDAGFQKAFRDLTNGAQGVDIQTKELNATFQDFAATLIGSMSPSLASVFRWYESVASAESQWLEVEKKGRKGFEDFIKAHQPANDAARILAAGMAESARQSKADEEAKKKHAAALEKSREALKKYNDDVREVLDLARPYADILAEIDGNIIEGVRYYNQKGIAVERLAKMYGLTTQQVEALNSQLKIEALVAQAATQQIGKLGESFTGLFEGPMLEVPTKKIQQFGKVVSDTLSTHLPQSLGSKLSGVMQSIPGTLAAAFTGGGGFKGAFLSIGSQLGSTLGESIGKGVAMLGKLGGPIGAALGSLAGPLIGKIVGLFSKAEKQVNPVRQAFVDAAGGLATLNQRAAESGVTLRAMLDAKNPEQYKKAIDELNAAFEFQDNAMRKLDDAVKKYGFSLDELGPALRRQNLDKIAQGLYQDFKILTGAGIDVDTVLGKMGESIQEFVSDALRTGSEIPAAMEPMLKRMAEMGVLTDQNGNVIADLESAGVKFAMTMSEGFQRMIDEVKKLTDAIARGLGLAIANVPNPEITGRVKWEVDAVPGGVDRTYENDWSQTPVYPMANGGDFMVKRPTLFLAGEAGAERATFTPVGDGGAAPMSDVDALRQEIAGLRQQQREQQTYFVSMFPRDLARAVRDERQKQTYRRAS